MCNEAHNHPRILSWRACSASRASILSLAWRCDGTSTSPEVGKTQEVSWAGDSPYATGFVLQELLQGFARLKAHKQIIKHLSILPLLTPDRQDCIQAEDLWNKCRCKGIQAGVIGALLAQFCARHDLMLLTTNKDFQHIATVVPLRVWKP